MNNKILIGFKSCGKTTLGKLYCEYYPQYSFIDTDDLIKLSFYGLSPESKEESSRAGSIGDIYQQIGEHNFRLLESKIIKDLTKSDSGKNLVIATGGGSVLRQQNITNLKKIGKIIYLACDPQVIYTRWLKDNIKPKFINDEYTFERYILERTKLYEQAADQVISVTNLKMTELCNFG